MSEEVQTGKRVRQGYWILSPSLFNSYSEKMMDEAIGDDHAIVPGSAGAFQEMINKMNCTVKKYNMIINVKKQK